MASMRSRKCRIGREIILMTARRNLVLYLSTLVVAALVALVWGAQAFAAGSNVEPFKSLLGSWGGNGQFRLADGTTERIKCDAHYTGGAAQLRMATRCAGESNNIEIRSRLDYSDGRITGTWEERTFNAEGTVSGQASSDRLTLTISGGVSGSMRVSYSSSHQSVSISTQGVALQNVSMSLSRR